MKVIINGVNCEGTADEIRELLKLTLPVEKVHFKSTRFGRGMPAWSNMETLHLKALIAEGAGACQAAKKHAKQYPFRKKSAIKSRYWFLKRQ